MKIHLARNCAVVALFIGVTGFHLHEAVGQSAPGGTAPRYVSPYSGYSAPSQPGGSPYASTGYAAPAPQYRVAQAASPWQQSGAMQAQPSAPQQPYYTAMNSQNGAATSADSSPAQMPAPEQSGSANGSSAAVDCYEYPDYGISGYFGNCDSGRQWFCGIYGLAMERDEPSNVRLGLNVDTTGPISDYSPVASDTILTSDDADYDFRSGVELRFGSTFTAGGSCDYGDCYPCAPQTYAWELGYWYLADDSDSAVVIDSDPTDVNRYFSGVNFSGLVLLLDAENYVIPITVANSPPNAGDDRILAQRVRTNFSAQNLELNILRLPMLGRASAYGCGDCASSCGSSCGPSFTMAGLCGFRYMRLDDDFQYAVEFGDSTTTFDGFGSGDDAEMFYNISTDNHLAGFQLGLNTNYAAGSSWDLFWDTNFGLYNNQISQSQRVFQGGGTAVTFVNGGSTASVHSNKEDVSFVGEMRLGGAYHVTCNSRVTVAYRAVAITGVALTTDQIPTTFDNPAYVALIDSDGSIIIHGLQLGWERKF